MGNKKTAVLDIQSDTITLVMQDKKFSDSFSFHDSRSYSGFQNGEFLNKDELIGISSENLATVIVFGQLANDVHNGIAHRPAFTVTVLR